MFIGSAQAARGASIVVPPAPGLILPDAKEAYLQQLTTRIDQVAREGARLASEIQALHVVVPPVVTPAGLSLDQLKGQLRNCRSHLGALNVALEKLLDEADRVETPVFEPDLFPPDIWDKILKLIDDPKDLKALMMTSRCLCTRVWACLSLPLARRAVQADMKAYRTLVAYNNPTCTSYPIRLTVLMRCMSLEIFPPEYFRDSKFVDMIMQVRPEFFFDLPQELKQNLNLVRVAFASASLQVIDERIVDRFFMEYGALLTPEDLEIMRALDNGKKLKVPESLTDEQKRIAFSPLEALSMKDFRERYELVSKKSFRRAVETSFFLHDLRIHSNSILNMIRCRLQLD